MTKIVYTNQTTGESVTLDTNLRDYSKEAQKLISKGYKEDNSGTHSPVRQVGVTDYNNGVLTKPAPEIPPNIPVYTGDYVGEGNLSGTGAFNNMFQKADEPIVAPLDKFKTPPVTPMDGEVDPNVGVPDPALTPIATPVPGSDQGITPQGQSGEGRVKTGLNALPELPPEGEVVGGPVVSPDSILPPEEAPAAASAPTPAELELPASAATATPTETNIAPEVQPNYAPSSEPIPPSPSPLEPATLDSIGLKQPTLENLFPKPAQPPSPLAKYAEDSADQPDSRKPPPLTMDQFQPAQAKPAATGIDRFLEGSSGNPEDLAASTSAIKLDTQDNMNASKKMFDPQDTREALTAKNKMSIDAENSIGKLQSKLGTEENDRMERIQMLAQARGANLDKYMEDLNTNERKSFLTTLINGIGKILVGGYDLASGPTTSSVSQFYKPTPYDKTADNAIAKEKFTQRNATATAEEADRQDAFKEMYAASNELEKNRANMNKEVYDAARQWMDLNAVMISRGMTGSQTFMTKNGLSMLNSERDWQWALAKMKEEADLMRTQINAQQKLIVGRAQADALRKTQGQEVKVTTAPGDYANERDAANLTASEFSTNLKQYMRGPQDIQNVNVLLQEYHKAPPANKEAARKKYVAAAAAALNSAMENYNAAAIQKGVDPKVIAATRSGIIKMIDLTKYPADKVDPNTYPLFTADTFEEGVANFNAWYQNQLLQRGPIAPPTKVVSESSSEQLTTKNPQEKPREAAPASPTPGTTPTQSATPTKTQTPSAGKSTGTAKEIQDLYALYKSGTKLTPQQSARLQELAKLYGTK